ncbi:MAG TPA: cysteine-rich CWC family protein [Accumulibacter sp.]|uniref:cysteine-rich CWC family protein n=1 Tax=Accumulibacter sp. TaxID=2053492 RepID=UPI00287949E5|nr:cysteine-rich CWC family protein [Accumulibacter sp.]MDS4054364.1 cysteine-rich CWC family protein [Accumulibacter sp.]HMV03956.1 cysteine-rich CWC family protein [Accumulibacter sp.]HMW63921.1 cysteine-rich CWC family protein [Accumulibacter sp.]HMW80157.1 cysteine-rich CWC family protein [Accumulibacter sp.]HNB67317.1 cysteine-rich CWC family protein [Accumulibacter sp.]
MLFAARRGRRCGGCAQRRRCSRAVAGRGSAGARLNAKERNRVVSEEVLRSICSACGASFVCGAAAGLASCWCMQRPPLALAPLPGGSCYCPDCLTEKSSRENDDAARSA